MKKLYMIAAIYLEEFLELEAKQQEALLNREAYSFSEDEDENDDRPYQVVNGVALYSITGKMMASGNWFTKWIGIPDYETIGDVIAQMATDDEVVSPLISMSTPGGMMAGLSDLSDSWRKLNNLKPVSVHTTGFLGSAGVWLASNSSKIFASEVAEVGSIGAIIQHVSHQARLEKEGIKVTEIKSSPLKAVGSPAKDLSASDLAYMQKKVDEGNALFRAQLGRTRPLLSEDAFTGGMFSSAEALRLGLIDGIKTFSTVFEELSASVDSVTHQTTNIDGGIMKRKVTAQMAEAAIGLGAKAENFEVITQEEYDALVLSGEIVPGTIEDEVELDAEGNPIVAEGSESDDDGDEPSEEVVALNAQVVTLSTELGTATAEVETLSAQVADLTTKLEASASDPLRVIAEDRIKTMRIALGLTNIDMADFSVTSLLAEFDALDTQFKKAFVSGGTYTKKPDGEEIPKKKAKITSLDTARFSAVGAN